MWGRSNCAYAQKCYQVSCRCWLANTKLNLWGHPCTSTHGHEQQQQQKMQARQVLKKKKWGWGDWRFTWMYACWVSTTVMLTSVSHQKTKFHRISHGHEGVCIRLLEESHDGGNYTALHRLRGNLKPSLALFLQGELESRYAAGF